MGHSSSEPISGTAAGVPFTALPPPDGVTCAPLVVVWHLMDPPCTDSSMAAAVPMNALPAWRLYFGLPMTGRRLPAGGFEELMRLGYADGVVNLFGPILSQAADEAPAAVAAVRTEFGIADGPIGVAGGSLGGGVALEVIAARVLSAGPPRSPLWNRRCSWSAVRMTTRNSAPTPRRWSVSSPPAIGTARAFGCIGCPACRTT